MGWNLDILNPMRSTPGLTQLPCWPPLLREASSVSRPKRLDSARLYEEKNHPGQGHSRDTLLQTSPPGTDSRAVGRSRLPGRKFEASLRGRVRTDTAVNTCIANKAVTEPTLFLTPRMIPDCLGNRDRRTRGGYFRPLAFEELSCALLGYSWGQLSLHPRSRIQPSLIRTGRG